MCKGMFSFCIGGDNKSTSAIYPNEDEEMSFTCMAIGHIFNALNQQLQGSKVNIIEVKDHLKTESSLQESLDSKNLDLRVDHSDAIDDLLIEVQQLLDKNHVLILTKPSSSDFEKIKTFLDSLNVSYKTEDIDSNKYDPKWQEYLDIKFGIKTIPCVFVNSQYIGDHADLEKLHEKGKLFPLIEAAISRTYEYDLIVIGGGSGGLSASKRAAELGKKVAVLDYVEPTPKGTTWGLGGTCVNVGCVPKKLMHQAAILGHQVNEAKQFGWKLSTDDLKLKWSKLVKAVQSHIASLNFSYQVELRDKKVNYVNSYGKFENEHTIKATNRRGKETTMTADKFIIAVGERPRYPDIPGAKELCITSDDLFSLSNPPGKTLVIGASYVALECAGFLKGIGFDVTLMVRSIFLRGFDQQMAKKIEAYYRDVAQIKILQGYVPEKVEKVNSGNPGKIRVHAVSTTDKSELSDQYNTVILAIGRESVTKTIGFENVGIEPGKNGKISVNDEEQTSVSNIYCIGDNAEGKPELTPVAVQAGKLLAERLYGGSTTKCDYVNVPTTVFTPIEYSCCGYSEEAATQKFGADNIEVYHSNFIPLEWTIPKKNPNICYAKVVTDKSQSEKVVGIHYFGPNAGEVMQGFAAAMKCGITKELLDSTIGIHPTTAENITTLYVTKRSGDGVEASGC